MIRSLLIANRGEIACRVIRTARRMGIKTVAVYSDADARALHVRMADDAVHIGPSPPRESYLRGDRIIEAATQAGAEAIHPGYGFLSENADFAQAVIDAGFVWVGPKPDSIRAMGLKDAAKKLMAEAGVPVTPGYLGEDQDPKRLKKEAGAIGYPVLIKAVAGGGGKGMRRVDEPGQFDDALDSAKREAASSFGDDRVLIEKYVNSPRHIEVQVFGDSHGNVVHLFERDCSLQRRHQKVIEEAPAPGMDAETRAAVCGAAVRAAKAVNYENAGTIEFIADASEGLRADRIWFMEMNTRLQVEHPVTEEITGQDLVEWQLRVASGEKLPKTQAKLYIRGHAIEARLYAEDPANNFLPSIGRLDRFRLPHELPDHVFIAPSTGSRERFSYDGQLRLETGFEEGDEVSQYYDPMLAKLIFHGEDRLRAAIGLTELVASIECWPVKTNASMLHALLAQPDFHRGKLTTSFIDDHADDVIYDEGAGGAQITQVAQLFVSPDIPAELAGFRLNGPSQTTVRISDGRKVYEADLSLELHEDHDHFFRAEQDGNFVFASGTGETRRFSLAEIRGTGTSHGLHDGEIGAPMPGKVTAVEVSQGQKVAKGQRLLTLEAMKMEHALTAPFDGTVAELNATPGAQVTEGQLLVRVEAEQPSS
jgi:3-methylcrotonyl-CoA carboxylase alpha subunit